MAATWTTLRAFRHEPNKTVGLRKTIFGLLTVTGSEGASANDIPASLMGLTVIEEVSPAVKSDNSLIVVLAPAYSSVEQPSVPTSTSIIGKAAATAAAANIPVGTYAVTVKGY